MGYCSNENWDYHIPYKNIIVNTHYRNQHKNIFKNIFNHRPKSMATKRSSFQHRHLFHNQNGVCLHNCAVNLKCIINQFLILTMSIKRLTQTLWFNADNNAANVGIKTIYELSQTCLCCLWCCVFSLSFLSKINNPWRHKIDKSYQKLSLHEL